MVRLGLRLTLNGGKEAGIRVVVIAAAVALGVSMLLVTLAGVNAVNAQNRRYAWLETGAAAQLPDGVAAVPAPITRTVAADPLWWLLSADAFDGRIIGRVDLAATGSRSPVPPGITRLPGPGEFYASPALTKLLRSTPPALLGDRYAGNQIGTITSSALPAPNALIIVIGHRSDQLAHEAGALVVTSISTTAPSSCHGASCYNIGINSNSIDLIFAVVAAALLFPVLIFIGTASRLSAARREERFAAMRLVGATPGQVSVISAVESTVAATGGVAIGFGLFFLVRPALAGISFTGAPFFPHDLSLSLVDIALVAVGVPIAAAVAARLALRRVQISPLGVSRRVTPRPPRPYRLIPLAVGIGELAVFVGIGRPQTTPGQIAAYLPGILIVMAGLVIAGPWLTMAGSGVMARRTRRPATLIASRRLSDNPRAGFRAISGLVLALFIATVSIGVIDTINANRGSAVTGAAAAHTLVDQFSTFTDAGPPTLSIPSIPDALLAEVRSIPGVRALTIIHADPDSHVDLGPASGVVSCAELARTPAVGHCPAGADTVTITSDFGNGKPTVTATAPISQSRVDGLPVEDLVVGTDGSTSAIERARTVLENAYGDKHPPLTIAEDYAQFPSTRRIAGYQRLVDVVIVAGLVMAGCSLAVSVAAGLSDRKRPFSLLRLTGAPLAMLRRVVALESAVPLLVIALVSIATGFLAAGLFVRSQLGESLQAPGTTYFVVVAAGLFAALAIILSTLPLLNRMTGPEVARNE
jgi:hypothetical protein